MLPKTVRLLMGAVPDDLEFDEIVETLRQTNGVKSVHHVHLWSISEHSLSLEAHLVPKEKSLESFEECCLRGYFRILLTSGAR